MLIFIYGGDGYRRKQKLEEIRGSHPEKKESVLEATFDLLDADGLKNFQIFVGSLSLFHPLRRAILINAFACEEEKSLVEILKNMSEDRTLICVISEEKAPRKSFAFLKEKPVRAYLIKDLTSAELRAWINEEGSKRGMRIPQSMILYLEMNYASNLWGIITELDMLALQEKGAGREAPEEHDLLHADFFGLASALRPGGAPAQVFPALEVLLEREDPARIFNFLAYRARPDEKPLFADHDIAVKSGKLDYDTALLDVLIR